MRVKALEELLASDDGANLLIANRRAANIVSIEAKKDKLDFIGIPLSLIHISEPTRPY